jgi:formylglycine-generating enzyme required for sulfatase activity
MIRTPTIANALHRTVVLPPFWLLIAIVISLNVFHPLDTSVQAGSSSPASPGAAFGPTVPNTQLPQAKSPSGMVWIPGGEFSMGAQDPPDMDMVGMQATSDSRPIHRVYVDGFFMDKTDVTNGQFREFDCRTCSSCRRFSWGTAGKSCRGQRGLFPAGPSCSAE